MSKLSIILCLVILIVCGVRALIESPSFIYRYEVSITAIAHFAALKSFYTSKRKACNDTYDKIKKESFLNSVIAYSALLHQEETARYNLTGFYLRLNEDVPEIEESSRLTDLRKLADFRVEKCVHDHYQNLEYYLTKIDNAMNRASGKFNLFITDEHICLNGTKNYDLIITDPTIVTCVKEVKERELLAKKEYTRRIRDHANKCNNFYTNHNESLGFCVKQKALDPYEAKSLKIVKKWRERNP